MDSFAIVVIIGLVVALALVGMGIRLGAMEQRRIDRERHVRSEAQQYPEMREVV